MNNLHDLSFPSIFFWIESPHYIEAYIHDYLYLLFLIVCIWRVGVAVSFIQSLILIIVMDEFFFFLLRSPLVLIGWLNFVLIAILMPLFDSSTPVRKLFIGWEVILAWNYDLCLILPATNELLGECLMFLLAILIACAQFPWYQWELLIGQVVDGWMHGIRSLRSSTGTRMVIQCFYM